MSCSSALRTHHVRVYLKYPFSDIKVVHTVQCVSRLQKQQSMFNHTSSHIWGKTKLTFYSHDFLHTQSQIDNDVGVTHVWIPTTSNSPDSMCFTTNSPNKLAHKGGSHDRQLLDMAGEPFQHLRSCLHWCPTGLQVVLHLMMAFHQLLDATHGVCKLSLKGTLHIKTACAHLHAIQGDRGNNWCFGTKSVKQLRFVAICA